VNLGQTLNRDVSLPDWLPDAVRLYLDHTEQGLSLRHLARREGCHASTVLRQVRRYEQRRDDPLVDEALDALGQAPMAGAAPPHAKDTQAMTAPIRHQAHEIDEETIRLEAARVLRLLAEPATFMAIAPDMEKAVVLRPALDGAQKRLGVLDRGVAQVFALKNWIECQKSGRVVTYTITAAGRAEVKRTSAPRGMAEMAAGFDGPGQGATREEPIRRRVRYASTDSPVAVLARRQDREGAPFLGPDLVAVAERILFDFELAQMEPRVTQNWEGFLTGGSLGARPSGEASPSTPREARERVAAALRDLGPGLGDVVLRCCCHQEGLEQAERRMGWSARSGKIVLRIALQRLKRHYDETQGRFGPMIG
jgi:lambda repressor-like predicted transcriptional regulator